MKTDDWNRVEVLVDADIFRSNINGRGSAVAIDGKTGTFGPVALYVISLALVTVVTVWIAAETNRRQLEGTSDRPSSPH